MLYNLLTLVLDTVAGLFAGVLLLRFWMQIVRVRPPQEVAHFTFVLTDWIVKPMRRLIPGVAGIDWASLIPAYLIALLLTVIKTALVTQNISASVLLLALFSLLEWVIYGWTALLIFEVIFSWINPQAPLAPFVRSLNAPLLRPIRQLLPLLGGLDLSPMVLFLLLQVASRLLAYLSVMAVS